MNCRIVDGDNEKLRSVCFEEIEKIVDDKYQKTLEQYDDTDGEYETDNKLPKKGFDSYNEIL